MAGSVAEVAPGPGPRPGPGSSDEIRGEVVARLKLVLAGLAGCYCLIALGTSPCWGTSDDG